MRRVMIGTAGHIDHGKTSLVRALTGVDTDTQPEEKARGITIDLGFAPFLVEEECVAGLVDVPGHERFIRNMVAGVSGIDLLLLVVAADDAVMPQTREHLTIARLLGVRRGVVALTKVDLVDKEMADLVAADVADLLKGTPLEGSPILPVSSKTGAGIPELKERLRQEVARVPAKDPAGIFRLPIQRVFTKQGFGTIVTGIPISGRVRIDDPVEVQPGGLRGRVRGIQAYGRRQTEAYAGHSVSINLGDIAASDVRRGQQLVPPGLVAPVRMAEVEFEYHPLSPRPLKDLTRVRVHAGTDEVLAKLVLVDRDSLPAGQTALAQLRLERETVLVPGDRFVARLHSPELTIGGGRVVSVSNRRLHRTRQDVQATLAKAAREVDRPRDRFQAALDAAPGAIHAPADLARAVLRAPHEIDAWLRDAAAKGTAVAHPAGKGWIGRARLDALGASARERLGIWHDANKLDLGMPATDLRAALGVPPGLGDWVLDDLRGKGAVKEPAPGLLALAGRGASASREEEAALAEIERAFQEGKFAPPRPTEALARHGAAAKTLYALLLQRGILVEVAPDLAFHKEAVARAEAALREAAAKEGEVESGKFRDLLGTTRKFVIPLLEWFDKQGITKRVGNARFLRKYGRA